MNTVQHFQTETAFRTVVHKTVVQQVTSQFCDIIRATQETSTTSFATRSHKYFTQPQHSPSTLVCSQSFTTSLQDQAVFLLFLVVYQLWLSTSEMLFWCLCRVFTVRSAVT